MERVAQIATLRYGLDREAVLENLLYAAVLNSDHQLEMLALAAAKIAEDECPYRLLIVDSIIAHFRVEYSGRGELAERQQKLAVFMRELVKFAQCFNVAVVVCNQVTGELPKETARRCNALLRVTGPASLCPAALTDVAPTASALSLPPSCS